MQISLPKNYIVITSFNDASMCYIHSRHIVWMTYASYTNTAINMFQQIKIGFHVSIVTPTTIIAATIIRNACIIHNFYYLFKLQILIHYAVVGYRCGSHGQIFIQKVRLKYPVNCRPNMAAWCSIYRSSKNRSDSWLMSVINSR